MAPMDHILAKKHRICVGPDILKINTKNGAPSNYKDS